MNEIIREEFEMQPFEASLFFEGLEPKPKVEGFDLAANRSSISLWAQAASSYSSNISKLTNEWFNSVGTTFTHPKGLSSALTPKLKDFEKAMLDSYTKAFQGGALKMGNAQYRDIKNFSPSDKRLLRQKISKEMRYLKNFLSGDAKKKLAGQRFKGVRRSQGFINSLDSAFFEGMLAGADEAQIFFWELQGAVVAHCPDCITLNVGSPYLKKNLPTVPRAGITQCVHWCQCVLRAEGLTGEAEFGSPFSGSGLPQDASCGCWDAEGVPVASGVQGLFDDLYRQLNLARGKIFSTTGDMQKQWISQRTAINKDIIDLAQSYKIRVVPKWSVKDIKVNIDTLTKKGLVHITDLSSIPVGSNLYFVDGGSMHIGQAQIQGGEFGFNISGTWSKVNSPDDFLIFSGGE